MEITGHSIAHGSLLAIERLKRLEKMEKPANFLRPAARKESKNNQLPSLICFISPLLPHQSYATKLTAFSDVMVSGPKVPGNYVICLRLHSW